MRRELITKSIFLLIVYLFTLYNGDIFVSNLTTLSIIMLIVHIIGYISMKGSYDSVYYRFGTFYNSIRKEEKKQEKFKSFEVYKKQLDDTRTPMNWFNILFYGILVLLSFLY